ncbi:MAG: MMPL family transporter [Chloroflexi bacterium]|jgi:putative drug exporter of the RND superfamily|nr:MMPL family transporter [Chloroflexota bacterium]MBT4515162.1 MMPL family transporter [Chloroflexota bacterium]
MASSSTQTSGPSLTGRLAGFTARHGWWTLGAWVVVLVAAFLLAGQMNLSGDGGVTSTDSARARDLIEEATGAAPPAEEFILVEANDGQKDEALFESVVGTISADMTAIPVVIKVSSYLTGEDAFRTIDGSKALIQVTTSLDQDDDLGEMDAILDVVEAANADSDLRVTTIGNASVELLFSEMVEETFAKGELIGIAAALVIMLAVFGAVVAALIPILLAIVAVFTAAGLIALITTVKELNEFTLIVTTMVGLAVGIDYTLFIVQRFREERDRGLERYEAITMAGSTASRTVLFSGVAVAIALAGMLIMPDVLFKSFGVGTIVVVITAVAAALTLLPAILGLLGDRVNWLTIPLFGKRRSAESGGGFWGAITGAVTAHPAISVVISAVILLGLTAPVMSLELGSGGISMLPEDTDERHAFDVLISEFSDGIITADIVVLSPDVSGSGVQSAITEVINSIEADDFFGSAEATTSPSGDLVDIRFAIAGDISSPESIEAIHRLRDDYIPAAFNGVDAEVLVGGDTARVIDDVKIVKKYVPLIMLAVLAASFLLLMIAFRSIVVPIKAVIMNLLSVGAAYGMVVLVFQKGLGNTLFGFQEVPVIESWIPLFLFAILFGLSMDYHVFLLSRIKERFDETGDNSGSVAYGLHSTASIITGAALVMVAVFGGFALGPLSMFQQMGFGLAVAVILDATIVRMVLVPASMELLGNKNWYFPSWLEWLPKISIEGNSNTPEMVAEGVPAGD